MHPEDHARCFLHELFGAFIAEGSPEERQDRFDSFARVGVVSDVGESLQDFEDVVVWVTDCDEHVAVNLELC